MKKFHVVIKSLAVRNLKKVKDLRNAREERRWLKAECWMIDAGSLQFGNSEF